MKEDKMENIHLIFKFLWYSVLFCIWGVSCTSSGTYKKTQMDIYMQYYDFIIDSLSKNPSYVCTPDNRRTVFIGAKVSPRQKEHIKSLAEQCGMTVSDYLLARAYNYKPKARLTKEEAVLLQNLDNCRADLVKYTSALHGMSASQRHMIFNQIPFMVNWLKELGNVAENVCQFLNSVKEPNSIPTNNKTEES